MCSVGLSEFPRKANASGMSEIQCNNITSSKKNKRSGKGGKHSKALDAFKNIIITENSDIENCPSANDKTAILKLVKRNLQKMCLTKSGPQHEIVALHDNILSRNSEAANLVEVFRYENRSRSTKELLRKTILERRKSPEFDKLRAEPKPKQKIWRPW